MPDILDASGLQIATISELIQQYADGLRAIYGPDINLDQNSPDGQLINILAQAGIDVREQAVAVYNSFDPDNAVGRVLDQRVVINNIRRKAGTFTIVPVEIVTSQTVTLQGLDDQADNPNGTGYTVQDDAGNQFILMDTSILPAGTHSLNFRARQIGSVETVVGTITNPQTIILGVVSVNNPSAALAIGQDEELDAQLRVRRALSVALASNGYLNGLQGAVLSLDGVIAAKLYENETSVTDANGTPPHCMWLIVEGGANSDIAQIIYEKKSFGCDMRGAVEVDITTPAGAIFTAKFDRPTAADLYIRFNLRRTNTGVIFDTDGIKEDLAAALLYTIGQVADTATITGAALIVINARGGGGLPLDLEISLDGMTWTDYLATPTLDAQFVTDPSRIGITVVT